MNDTDTEDRSGVEVGPAAEKALSDFKQVLYNKARALADEFWSHHFQGNKTRPFKESSILGVRLRRKGDDGFYIQWFWNKWVKTREGKVQTLSTHIRKGNGYQYPSWALEKYARDWEVDLVLELERQFAAIREKMRHTNQSRLALRRALAVKDVESVEPEGCQ